MILGYNVVLIQRAHDKSEFFTSSPHMLGFSPCKMANSKETSLYDYIDM